MTRKFFITGTDTNIGKTYIAVKLLKHYNSLGLKTIGIKPLATGCLMQNGVMVNEDALLLQENSSVKLDYQLVNPYSFMPAVSPNIASKDLEAIKISDKIKLTMSHRSDVYIVEGAGGWLCPINDRQTIKDVARELDIPVVLVVGMKLGCMNHAILTYENIIASKIPFHGWIANILDPQMEALAENILTLQSYIKHPILQISDFK